MKRIPDILTEAELDKVLVNARHKHHRIAYIISFYNGLRISEIVGLGKQISKCCRADIKKVRTRNKWNIRNTKYYCKKCEQELQTGDLRRSTIDKSIPALTPDMIYDGVIHLKNCKGNRDRNIPLAPEVEPYIKYLPLDLSSRSLQTAFSRICKRILNKKMHFHCLRHSAGTHYLNKWKNIRMVQTLLGHSNLSTTEIYCHIRPEQLMEAMQSGS